VVSVATALITTLIVGVTVLPRLEARNKKIAAAHAARDQFSTSVFTILAACGRLQAIALPAGASHAVSEAIGRERRRWLDQIDEATRFMIDNVEQFAFG
jgi:hypothetical protein